MSNIEGLTSARELQIRHATAVRSGMQVATRLQQGSSFSELLIEKQKTVGLEFSKHALRRIDERGMVINTNLVEDLTNAVEKAKGKGAKEVAVIGTDKAFIVDVSHNRVVTAMNAQEMKDSIFTNIDSAVLI